MDATPGVDAGDDRTVIVSVEGVSKTFPGQRAVDDVSLEILSGEVHALVGQNGSGKSTLIKILSGYHSRDPGGRIMLLGRDVDPTSSSFARERMHFIHQDLGLVDSLSTVDNYALGHGYQLGRGRRISWRANRTAVRRSLQDLGMDFDIQLPVGRLSAVERTMVAVARATAGWEEGPSLLVLDEVAASLPLPEVESLFAAIRRLTGRGAGVLYISHRLGEIFDIADRVTVLRDGKLVTTTSIGELDHDRLINLIVGRKLESMYVTSPPARPDVVLSLRDLQAGAIEQLSFDVHAGEMLGITGLVGSGMDDVAEAMVGAIRVDRGSVSVDGKQVSPLSIPSAKARGIELVPANRQVKGCIPQQSVRWNLTLGDLQPLRRWYGLSPTLERNETAEWIRRVDVRPPDQDKPLAQLSGGNQQKVVIAKCLRAKPRVLILHEPTQGVDVGARAAIWELLARVLEDDGAVIICSSEIEDLPHVCDRVLVMEEGRVQAELSGERLTDDNLTAAILSTVRINNPSTGSLAGDAS